MLPRQWQLTYFFATRTQAALSFYNLFIKPSQDSAALVVLFARSAKATLLQRHHAAEALQQQLEKSSMEDDVAVTDSVSDDQGVQLHEVGSDADEAQQDGAASDDGQVAEVAHGSYQDNDETASQGSSAWNSLDSNGRHPESNANCRWSQDSHNPDNRLSSEQELELQIQMDEEDERDRVAHNRWFYWTVANVHRAKRS